MLLEEEEELHSFMVLEVQADEDPVMAGVEKDEVEIMVDSGAAVSGCPPWFSPRSYDSPLGMPYRLRSATGEPLTTLTKRSVHLGLTDTTSNHINASAESKVIPGLVRPVFTVKELTRKGDTCIFAPDGAWIQRGSQCLELIDRGGGYFLKGRLTENHQKKTLMALEDNSSTVNPLSGASSSSAGQVVPQGQSGVAIPVSKATAYRDLPGVGNEEVPRIRCRPVPILPDQETQGRHALTHTPFRSWCNWCVRGKANEQPHEQTDGEEDMAPVVGMDLMFQNKKEDSKLSTALNAVDHNTSAEAIVPMPNKAGASQDYTAASVIEFLDNELCYDKVIIQSDTEPSLKVIVAQVKEKRVRPTTLRESPRYSHASQGKVERGNQAARGQVRTMVLVIEDNLKVEITAVSPILTWILRHSGWVITRFQIRADGHTSWYHVRGKEYAGEIAILGEAVLFKDSSMEQAKLESRWQEGIWLGKPRASDSHIVGVGNQAYTARTIRRQPREKRWNRELYLNFTAVPWGSKGQPFEQQAAPRRKYITKQYVDKYGPTTGCAGCSQTSTTHSEACRQRFAKTFDQEKLNQQPGEPRAAPEASSENLEEGPETAGKETRTAEVEMQGSDEAPATAETPTATGMESEDTLQSAPEVRSEGVVRRHRLRRKGPPEGGSEPQSKTQKLIASLLVDEMPDEETLYYLAMLEADQTEEFWLVNAADDPEEWETLEGDFAELSSVPDDVVLGPEDLLKEYENLPLSAFEGIRDEYTNELLDPAMVKAGRLTEIRSFVEFTAFSDEAEKLLQDCKNCGSRWVDHRKRLPDGTYIVRSRLVIQEFALGGRVDLFAGTNPAWVLRFFISLHASRRSAGRERTRKICPYDISVAFLHAKLEEKIAVRPPRDMRRKGRRWRLKVALNGTRKASQLFQDLVVVVMTEFGFIRIKTVPLLFFHEERTIDMVWHGDDALGGGEDRDIDDLDSHLLKHLKVKILPRIGNGAAPMGSYLNKTILWSVAGFELEPDQKYVPKMLQLLGLEHSKGRDTPGGKEVGKGQKDACIEVDRDQAFLFRSVAGMLLYLSEDLFHIKFATKEILRFMAKPTNMGFYKLRAAVKYLGENPRFSIFFEYQELPSFIDGPADSDWAGDEIERKSTSSGLLLWGKHYIDGHVSTQESPPLSSREAEYKAIVSLAARGLMLKQVMFEMKLPPRGLKLGTDSTAARGVCNRLGVGRIRHLELRFLWLQDKIEKGELTTYKLPGELNPADLGTKYVTRATFERLLALLPLRPSSRWSGKEGAVALIAMLIMVGQVEPVWASTPTGSEVVSEQQGVYHYSMQILLRIETGYEVMRGLFTLFGMLIAVRFLFPGSGWRMVDHDTEGDQGSVGAGKHI